MRPNVTLPFDIVIVGLGVKGIHQITHEAEGTIRSCSRVFVTDMATGVLSYLRSLSPHVSNLYDEYRVGGHRIPIYRRMASIVVSAALEKPPVCFATYGHPKVYCYPTTLIRRAARVLDLRVMVLPGISSLDTMLVDLDLDPAMDGIQIYEATDVVVRNAIPGMAMPPFVSSGSSQRTTRQRPGSPDTKG